MTDPYVLIDTSAWIEALRTEGVNEIRSLVTDVLKERRGATTGMIVVELLGGARNNREYQELREDLTALNSIPISEETWERAARLSYEMRRKGFGIPATDCLISAAAMIQNVSVLHCDKHFEQISKNAPLRTITTAQFT